MRPTPESPPPPSPSYGVDESFPIHHSSVIPHTSGGSLTSIASRVLGGSNRRENVLGHDVQRKYDDFMRGCAERYSKRECENTERDRVKMNMRQPASMANYTSPGYMKKKLDPELFAEIRDFYEKYKGKEKVENWPTGNTYTNHWESPTYMISLEDRKLRGGPELKPRIWDEVKTSLEEWTGMDVTPTSLYGIRVYKEGSMLAPHVDRMPLVTSAIIQVAQSVREDWALEVYDHDGNAHNITMEPGDLVLYESHSIIHGRPFPFEGDYYANIFVHFEPTGHSKRHEAKIAAEKAERGRRGAEEEYRNAKNVGVTGHEGANHDDDGRGLLEGEDERDKQGLEAIPIYIQKGSEEEKNWLRTHGRHKKDTKQQRKDKLKAAKDTFSTGSSALHTAAQQGDLEEVTSFLATVDDPKSHVQAQDSNGWQPLHEAARGGHTEVAKVLIANGADKDARTNEGKGATPLWWVRKAFGDEHQLVQFLQDLGAKDIGQEL
ncbi:hypothetical protein TeGR_g6460 [Tetraparma gracilis]|uniref:Uncharacterized protein n=1 Tax=Tetraparma gracilis TaxID=2962635 RepID=A0ABQ6N427_9STRA|nr:hypothetical protein TeGR_g6460 [Tetraparma gracilis]